MYVGHCSVVLSHADIVEREEALFALKALKVRIDKGSGDFTRSVGAEVVEDNAVVWFNSRAAVNDDRDNKLIGNAVCVAVPDRLNGAGSLNAFAVNQSRVCLFNTLPAVISVHSVVSAHYSGNLAYADFFAFGNGVGDILCCA